MATTYIAISKANSVYCMKECMYNYERKREGNISSELNTIKAAWSYYCGCLNCEERISFCRQIPQYSDMLPIIVSNLYIWSKLCIETAINLDRDEYNAYCQKVKNILRDISVSMPLRIRLIARFSGIYYYLYPIIRRNKWQSPSHCCFILCFACSGCCVVTNRLSMPILAIGADGGR